MKQGALQAVEQGAQQVEMQGALEDMKDKASQGTERAGRLGEMRTENKKGVSSHRKPLSH